MKKHRNLKRSAAPAVSPEGFIPGSTMDRRAAPETLARFALGSYDSESRTVEAVFSTGSRVRRWGIFEELAITPEAIDLARVSAGQVRLLDSHSQDSIDDILGTVESARIEGDQLIGRIRFAASEAGRNAEAMVAAGDVGGISIGYRVTTWSIAQIENDIEVWRADRWELLEVSLVAVPADAAGMVRQINPSPTQPEIDDMRRNTPAGDPPVPVNTPAPVAPVIETRAAPAPAPAPTPAPAPQIDLAAERSRVRDLNDIARRASLDTAVLDAAIAEGTSVTAFRALAFDALAERQQPRSAVRIERDETETRRSAMEEALFRGIGGVDANPISEPVRAYMRMPLYALAAIRMGERQMPFTIADREDVYRRAMHTTSDFPILLENALNRRLVGSYGQAEISYRAISMREDFNDFRPHDSVSIGDFPLLAPIAEAGKIQFGTVGEKKETVAVLPYAIGLSITRQLVVNDSLNGIEALLARYGESVATFEEVTFYNMKALNSGAGPNLLEGAAAMFTTGRGNLAAAGTAITLAALGAARAAMRKYRAVPPAAGGTGNILQYNAPSILLVGPDQENAADQILTTITPATNAAAVPTYVSSLTKVVAPQFGSSLAWELYVKPSVRSNYRWGLLNGYTAPRIRVEQPFGTQGTLMSVEHDFGVGGIDWRAAYRNPGA